MLSIECALMYKDWCSDAAISFGIGTLDDDVDKLNQATELALVEATKLVVPGNYVGDISHAIESTLRSAAERFGVDIGIIRDSYGHGIGEVPFRYPFWQCD